MNILLVSQCKKNALFETRRIIDQFAERCGSRTWQTQITQQGLATLRALLKRRARKNTAVACHWIRGKNNTEILWIVGNANCFNEKGAVPTNITQRNILRQSDENDWHTLTDIQILAAIAALFHDFGKANQIFQAKLAKAATSNINQKTKADAYRHEWVSLRLFQAFVGNDTDTAWLTRLAALDQNFADAAEKACLAALIKDGITTEAGNPFKNLPPVAKAIGWLIVTHHRLLQPPDKQNNRKQYLELLNLINHEWNSLPARAPEVTLKDKQGCWQFKKLPFSSRYWCASASHWGKQALQRPQLIKTDWLTDFYSLHLARLSLMLADHFYSSLPAHNTLSDKKFKLYANTDKEGKLKQRLDEHLTGVAKHAKRITNILPALEQSLPRIARHKGFKRRTTKPQFRWQNTAYDLACALRQRTLDQGFFGVNMASTGCGKTLANGRIMYGLANPTQGARFCIALGLRTLTLQTGKVYRDQLGLGEDDLAVLVGSAAVKKLFALSEKTEEAHLVNSGECLLGSESAASLMPDNSYVQFDGSMNTGSLQHWLKKNPDANKLLSAPILTCTIDYLIEATEGTRGGKQLAPMLRLMTSDLVLDEPDDFDINDLPALSRLVHWAGMLGSRVLLSSATLPPALIEGLFTAYHAGRAMFQQSRGIPGKSVNICCAWFDEYQANTHDCIDAQTFVASHQKFVTKRVAKLAETETRRKATIKSLGITSHQPLEIRQTMADIIHIMCYELHQAHHTIDPKTKKQVSFGLVRFANIDPLIDVAQHLFKLDAKDNHRIKLCCYHARHPLLIRNQLENQLDQLLDRRNDKQNPAAIFSNPWLRNILDNTQESNIMFIVLASPVAEVGRDHDYDWAIVEPSSMRSIIQLAGRIKRHRAGSCTLPNIFLLETNLKSLEQTGAVSFCKPGFEKNAKAFKLVSHKLTDILKPQQYETISAAARILANENLTPNHNLVDLEHARLQAMMLSQPDSGEININAWWESQVGLTGILQYQTPFRYDPRLQERFALMLDEDQQELKFFNLDGKQPKACQYRFTEIKLERGEGIEPLDTGDYLDNLVTLAYRLDMDIKSCGQQFGEVILSSYDEGSEWLYHPVLGLRRKN